MKVNLPDGSGGYAMGYQCNLCRFVSIGTSGDIVGLRVTGPFEEQDIKVSEAHVCLACWERLAVFFGSDETPEDSDRFVPIERMLKEHDAHIEVFIQRSHALHELEKKLIELEGRIDTELDRVIARLLQLEEAEKLHHAMIFGKAIIDSKGVKTTFYDDGTVAHKAYTKGVNPDGTQYLEDDGK